MVPGDGVGEKGSCRAGGETGELNLEEQSER